MKAFNISELPSKKKCQSSWIASRSIAPIMIWYNVSPDTRQIKGLMANLCADPSVDIQLRLQLLETLELRSLGWRRHPAMADYYRSPNDH